MTAAAAADDLSALKAQLEVLQSKVSKLETAPAPQVRPGERR
jgi:ubiquinone biosynthesis protein UbiJ